MRDEGERHQSKSEREVLPTKFFFRESISKSPDRVLGWRWLGGSRVESEVHGTFP
jgi:hypothetical protein